jgi:hypothetical protein
MKKVAKCLVAALFIVFLASAYPAGSKESAASEQSAKYIEVCSNGIVYLPPHTKYVTCHGKVMKVLAIVPRVEGVQIEGGCNCPECCGGWCGVTVSCPMDEEPSTGTNDCGCGKRSAAGGGLCTAYLGCGD